MKYISEEHDKFKTKNNTYRIISTIYYLKNCKKCGELCLCVKNSVYCSLSCASGGKNNSFYGKKHTNETKMKIGQTNKIKRCGKKHSEETKEKIRIKAIGRKHTEKTKKKLSESKCGKNHPCFGKFGKDHPSYGKKLSEETKRKMSNNRTNENNPCWRNGVTKLNIPLYSTYGSQLEKYEDIRKSEEGYLEVRCTYCGKWFVPKMTAIVSRVKAINGKESGESRLYCSQLCKKECPIYGKTPEQLMKEDAIRAGRILPNDFNREVQPELRQLVFLRDDYECQICGLKEHLHCHHYEGIEQNPLESADMDNCITLCKKCHIKAHQQSGCTYYELRKQIC